jgi:hypothetical protein
MFGVDIGEIVDELTRRIENLERIQKKKNIEYREDDLLQGKIMALEEFRAWLSIEYL